MEFILHFEVRNVGSNPAKEVKTAVVQSQPTLEQQQEFARLVYSTTQSFGTEVGQGKRQLKLPNGEILSAQFPQYLISVQKDEQVIFQAQHRQPQGNSMSAKQMQVCNSYTPSTRRRMPRLLLKRFTNLKGKAIPYN